MTTVTLARLGLVPCTIVGLFKTVILDSWNLGEKFIFG